MAAYTGINAGGYLPIALPAENSNLAEVYSRGRRDLGGFFSGIKYQFRILFFENKQGQAWRA